MTLAIGDTDDVTTNADEVLPAAQFGIDPARKRIEELHAEARRRLRREKDLIHREQVRVPSPVLWT